MRKVVIASLLGATIEWYDFFLYGVVAGIVFNKLYFPTADPFIGTILAYSTFAIGYLARPLGGFIFGHYGDKLGRKRMLILTMLIMGIATMGIGLVPTYASIGIAAYIHKRCACQGAARGEWGGAVLAAYEYASDRQGLLRPLSPDGSRTGLYRVKSEHGRPALLAAGQRAVSGVGLALCLPRERGVPIPPYCARLTPDLWGE